MRNLLQVTLIELRVPTSAHSYFHKKIDNNGIGKGEPNKKAWRVRVSAAASNTNDRSTGKFL